MLLRKLGVYSRHSALYKAFSELGRVQRTIFLLTYMSDPALQQHIRAETTKVEAYHHFTDWLAFGSPVLQVGTRSSRRNVSSIAIWSPMR